MNHALLSVIAFAVIGLSSCKKEEGVTPESAKSGQVSNKVIQVWD